MLWLKLRQEEQFEEGEKKFADLEESYSSSPPLDDCKLSLLQESINNKIKNSLLKRKKNRNKKKKERNKK